MNPRGEASRSRIRTAASRSFTRSGGARETVAVVMVAVVMVAVD